MVWRVYQRVIWGNINTDRRWILDGLYENYSHKEQSPRIYNAEAYQEIDFIKNFWESEAVVLVVNDQIGDSTLSIPLIVSLLKTGKQIIIFTLHVDLLKQLLLLQNWVDSSQVIFMKRDSVLDFHFTGAQFCINLHRTLSLEWRVPQENHLSLDWRILPRFHEDYYALPDRFALLVEILMWYKTSIHLTLRETTTSNNYLLVPRSSLDEKELSDDDWMTICQTIKENDPQCIFYIDFGNPDIDEKKHKYFPLVARLRAEGFSVSWVKNELWELPQTLMDLSPKVIAVDTGLAHIAAILWLPTIIVYRAANSKFWSFPAPNVFPVTSKLSEFLTKNEYGFFDPFFWNSKLDDTTKPLSWESGIDIESVLNALSHMK
jgi:Glycosyltransferase family 9 (heptosyltransferase)